MTGQKRVYIFLGVAIFLILAYRILIQVYYKDIMREPILTGNSQEDETFLSKMKQKEQELKNVRPMPDGNYAKDQVYEEGSIKIVKDQNFQEVAQKPKTAMQVLQEMAAKRDRSPVGFSEKDLNKSMGLKNSNQQEDKLKGFEVPEVGEESKSRISKINAPVNYKIFKGFKEWEEFLKFNKTRPIEKIDFEKENVLILVSASDLPNGIFMAESVKSEGNMNTVYYRVNPLEMAVESESKTQKYYSAIKVPKNGEIKLEQL